MKAIYHLMCSNTQALCSLKDSIDFSAVIARVLISEMDLSGRWNIFGPYGLQWHVMESHCCRWMICCIKLIIARVMLPLPAMRRKDNMRSLDERPFDGRRSWLMWLKEHVFMEVPVFGCWLGSCAMTPFWKFALCDIAKDSNTVVTPPLSHLVPATF